jgi:hypothetical protein
MRFRLDDPVRPSDRSDGVGGRLSSEYFTSAELVFYRRGQHGVHSREFMRGCIGTSLRTRYPASVFGAA